MSEKNPVKIQIRTHQNFGYFVWHTDPGRSKLPPMVNVYFNWDSQGAEKEHIQADLLGLQAARLTFLSFPFFPELHVISTPIWPFLTFVRDKKNRLVTEQSMHTKMITLVLF